MRNLIYVLFIAFILFALPIQMIAQENPLIRKLLNERYDFEKLQPEHIEVFREYTIKEVNRLLENYFTEPFPVIDPENVLYPLDSIDDLFYHSSVLYVLAEAHPNETIRNLGFAEMQKLDSVKQSVRQNRNVYNRLIALQNAEGSNSLTASHQNAITLYQSELLKNGVHLEGEKKEKFQELSNALLGTGMMFMMNSQMLKDTFYTTKERLAGMSDSFLESHNSDDNNYFFVVPGPDYDEILEYADDEQIRKQAYLMKMEFAYDANKELLNKMLEIRSEIAKLLGYENYAAFQTEDNMVGGSANLEVFLRELTPGIKTLMENHYNGLVSFNQNNVVNPWDIAYLERKKLLHDTHLDLEELKKYFPAEKVIAGLLEVTGKMFDIEYQEVTDFSTWHEDVMLFEIISKGELIGNIYLDVYAREGKSAQGAACGPIVSARKSGTVKQIPQLVLVASFSNSKPSLLSTDDVFTLFHEMGHGMNFLFQESEFLTQLVGNGEWDFIEIPSTVLELGVWEKEIVKQITEHVETHVPLPDSLLQPLHAKIKQDQINRAAFLLYSGIWDLQLHTTFDNWTDEQYSSMLKETWEDVFPYPYPESVKNPLTSAFIIGIEAYAANLYTYLWSLVYAQDVLSVFRENGILNPEIGEKYRKEILAPGATESANESLVNFLGREPSQIEFLRIYGLE
jgi:thimet oligopeptidase